jgi:hypothetical protein
MNKLIKELAEQAEDWADSQNFYASDYRDYLMEKFARLIVQEIFSEMAHQLFLHSDLQASDPGYQKAMTNTLKKFGVEDQSESNVDRILQTVRTRGQ